MKPSMEQTLDQLLANAARLRECEEEKGECLELQHQQEFLLNALLKMDLEEETSYGAVEKKMAKLSQMNRELLRSEPLVKKARSRRKKQPTQLPLI